MPTYSMKITQMDCLPQADGQTDVVVCAHWAYTGTEGDRTGAAGGKTTFTYTPGSPFTPFSNLTEQQVADWVLGAWSAEYKASVESLINEQLGVVVPPLPWATPTPGPAPSDQ